MPKEELKRPLKNRELSSERKKNKTQSKRSRHQSANTSKYSPKSNQAQRKKKPRRKQEETVLSEKKKIRNKDRTQKERPIIRSYSKSKPNQFYDDQKLKKGYRILNVVANTFFYAFLFVVLVGGSLIFLLKNNDTFLFGYQAVSAETNSMVSSDKKDGFSATDLLLIKREQGETSKVGDIVTFYTNPEEKTTFLTHRIIQKLTEYNGQQGTFFITQGDANSSPDSPISSEAIIGKKVATLPKIGGILVACKENWKMTSIIITILFVILFLVKFLVSYLRKQEIHQK